MLLSGIPVKVVSEILGHSSVSITLDLYAHVLQEQRDDAAQKIDDLLWG
jgi:integrase